MAAAASAPLSAEDLAEMLECARYGEVDELRELLSQGADVNHCRAEDGSTALHMACANGHSEVAALLLARGASHIANHAGNTPLHWACLNGHAGVADVLLASGRPGEVDVYAMNRQGKSAFTVAISAGHEALARSMLQHASAEPPATFAGGAGGGAGGSAGGGAGATAGEEGDDLEAEDGDLLEGAGEGEAEEGAAGSAAAGRGAEGGAGGGAGMD